MFEVSIDNIKEVKDRLYNFLHNKSNIIMYHNFDCEVTDNLISYGDVIKTNFVGVYMGSADIEITYGDEPEDYFIINIGDYIKFEKNSVYIKSKWNPIVSTKSSCKNIIRVFKIVE